MKGQEVVDILMKEIGTKEFPVGSNKVKYNTWMYNKEVSGPQYPWCGAFVSWGFDAAGYKLGNIGMTKGFVGCPYAVGKIAKWGKQVTVPQAGDVVFFDWNGDGLFDHTGVFVKDLGKGFFQAIEGNTAVGNDSNGGEVMLRERKYKNAIFVRPNSIM